MTKLPTIDTDTLAAVTGGAQSPCTRMNALPLGQTSSLQLALANQYCGLKLPTAADTARAKRIRF